MLVFDRPSGLIAATNLSREPATIALPDDAGACVWASGEVDGAVTAAGHVGLVAVRPNTGGHCSGSSGHPAFLGHYWGK